MFFEKGERRRMEDSQAAKELLGRMKIKIMRHVHTALFSLSFVSLTIYNVNGIWVFTLAGKDELSDGYR